MRMVGIVGMVDGNNNGKTAMALRAAVATTTATATALRSVVAITRGDPAAGGDDDGDYGRSWRCAWHLGGPWRGRGRYVAGIAGDGPSKRCSANARGRYVVGWSAASSGE
jgi:hypothetical protein